MSVTETARAKINLTLHVTGQRGDGYHLLDSLVVFADLGDRITVTPAERLGLTITGPESADQWWVQLEQFLKCQWVAEASKVWPPALWLMTVVS